MVIPTRSTIDNLSLAKEMYIIGLQNGRKNTRVDRMQSILNFDFAVSTIIITVCGDMGEEVKQKNGRSKKWDELIDSLKKIYSNQSMIQTIDNLHDVRNLTQHGAKIPSEYDIEIHRKTVHNFFMDICANIYENKITFDTISLAKILKSPHETRLLLRAEECIELGDYNLARNLIQITALYHYQLIRENLSIRITQPTNLIFDYKNTSDILRQNIDSLWESLNMIIDQFSMGEFYIQFKDLMKGTDTRSQYAFPHNKFQLLKFPTNVTKEDIEMDRINIYKIILGTENLLVERVILGLPVIYRLHVTEVTTDSAVLNYEILGKENIIKCEALLYSKKDTEETTKRIEIPCDDYVCYAIPNLLSDREYRCTITTRYKDDNSGRMNEVASQIVFRTT